MADGLENGKLCAMNFGGEKLGACVEGDDGVHGAGDDLRGNGDFD